MGEILKQARRIIDQKVVDMLDPFTWERIRAVDAGQNEYGFDPFGFDPEALKYIGPPLTWLLDTYFRAEFFGLENVPDSGRVMLISNHSGQIAIDGVIIGGGLLLKRNPPRMIRSMVEYWVPTIPFVSWIFSRIGQVTGTRENARILLGRGGCLLAFPEGVRGISKTFDRAYQLEQFGLGFMRLALETETPIVPIGVIGGEEQIPSVYNLKPLAAMMGMPAFPLAPTGALPLPVKYRVYFGEPMYFEGKHDDEDRVIRAKVDQVKAEIARLLDRGLKERKGIFF